MKTMNVRGLVATATILLIICMGTAAAVTPSVTVVTPTTDLCPDDQFTVTVDVNSEAEILQGAFLDLTYDPTVFDVVSVTLEDELFTGEFMNLGTGDDDAGTIDFGRSRMGGTAATESGTLATIVFEVNPGVTDGTYTLGLQNVQLMDGANELINPVTKVPGAPEVDCGSAPATPSVTVVTPTTDLCPDDQFTVTVDVNSEAEILQGAFLDLTYDPTVFDVVSVTLEDELFTGEFMNLGTGDDDAGTIDFGRSRMGGTAATESGTLATIVFEVNPGVTDGTYALGLQNVQLMDGANELIDPVDEFPGTVTVTTNDPPTVTVTSPVSGTVSGTIDVTATATDTDGTVTQVAFYLMPAGTLIGTDTNAAGGWSCPLDTTTAADGTGYQIKAVATDNEGATGDDTGGAFAIDNSCSCDFCLDLEAGLNFVSIPKTLVDSPKNATTVFDVDYYSGEFCLYYDASAGSFDLNADVKPCRGFLVYKNAAKSICVDFDDTAPAPSQQLYEGWNMIGHIKPVAMPINDGTTADFVSITGLEEPEGNELFRLMATYTGTGWSEYPSGSLTDATPGAGYWIYMNQNVMMSGGFE